MKYLYRHIIVWAIFITYELSFISLSGVKLSNWTDYLLHYGVNALLFYVNASAFKYIYSRRQYRHLIMIGVVVLEISCYIILQYFIAACLGYLHEHAAIVINYSRRTLIVHIYRAIYFIGFSIGYWFAQSVVKQKNIIIELENLRLKEEKQSAELENRLVQTKNAYLLSQLNPHLLFNTLNFIYNSVRKLSAQAASAILLLSEMMRYALAEPGADGKVPLNNEIEHIKSFVTLNQLRFRDELKIELNLSGDFYGLNVIPLVLISFVENMYKHGDLSDADNPANIEISCQDNLLSMNCINKKKQGENYQRLGHWRAKCA
jgi:two-component system LytT family sensor kinase